MFHLLVAGFSSLFSHDFPGQNIVIYSAHLHKRQHKHNMKSVSVCVFVIYIKIVYLFIYYLCIHIYDWKMPADVDEYATAAQPDKTKGEKKNFYRKKCLLLCVCCSI